jgi:DNA-binding transcriptional MocR family regulator
VVEARDLAARIDGWRGGRGHTSARLASRLTELIREGQLPAGSRLPPERSLADVLEVSRGTVVRAYGRLRDHDLVHTRHGSGTVVGGAHDRLDSRAVELAQALTRDSIVAAVGERDRASIDLRAAVWAGERAVMTELFAWNVDDLHGVGIGDSGYWPLGLPTLRTAIADHLSESGLPTVAEQVIVTNGAQQAVDVVLATVAAPHDPVLLPEVTWPGIMELLPLRALRPAVVPHDDRDGVDEVALLSALRSHRAPLAYLVPSFHNPTGAVMPAHTRRLVVEAAAEGGVVLIDDLTLADLWLDGPPPAPLGATVPQAAAQVVSVGSLSKSTWGGLRVGWLRAEPGPLLERLSAVKTVLDLGNSVPSQLAALAAFRAMDRILASRRQELAARRAALSDALAEHLPDWSFAAPSGGLSLWVDLGGASGDAFAAVAADHGVRVPPARVCHALGRDTGHLRLTLAHDAATLSVAVDRLADAWRSYLTELGRGVVRRPAVL